MTDYTVVVTTAAWDDLARIQDFALERELQSSTPDYAVVDRIVSAFERSLRMLEFAPYTCRRSAAHGFRRELVAAFGSSGMIMLIEIRDREVFVIAIRHQLEQDFRH